MNTDPVLPPFIHVLERGWLSSNNVLLLGRHETVLVDSGYGSHADQTAMLVQSVLGDRPLNRLLNTHLHSDHCGGNAALQASYPEVVTWIPPGHAAEVAAWDPEALSHGPTGQDCPRFRFDGVLSPGSEVRLGDTVWQIHAAPGHDPHAVILFEPDDRLLISGDALWENGFGVVFPELEDQPGFDDVGQTLDLIARLAPRTVIPGHGRPFGQVARALDVARRRLSNLRQTPRKHALHASKVLVKFKLLELQCVRMVDLLRWALATRYFTALHQRHFADIPCVQWLQLLVRELTQSGVIAVTVAEDGTEWVENR